MYFVADMFEIISMGKVLTSNLSIWEFSSLQIIAHQLLDPFKGLNSFVFTKTMPGFQQRCTLVLIWRTPLPTGFEVSHDLGGFQRAAQWDAVWSLGSPDSAWRFPEWREVKECDSSWQELSLWNKNNEQDFNPNSRFKKSDHSKLYTFEKMAPVVLVIGGFMELCNLFSKALAKHGFAEIGLSVKFQDHRGRP